MSDKPPSEILKALNDLKKYKYKVTKMTREEATEKVLNLGYENGMLVTALEALGLIKFEEPRLINGGVSPALYSQHCIAIEDLMANGYKIVKAD